MPASKNRVVWVLFFQHGITQANELVNLTEFFVNHIQPDLKSASGKLMLTLIWHFL